MPLLPDANYPSGERDRETAVCLGFALASFFFFPCAFDLNLVQFLNVAGRTFAGWQAVSSSRKSISLRCVMQHSMLGGMHGLMPAEWRCFSVLCFLTTLAAYVVLWCWLCRRPAASWRGYGRVVSLAFVSVGSAMLENVA